MKINDAVFGALLLVLGLAVLLHVQSFPKIPGQNVGPALFPGSVAGALVVCALLLIVSGVRSRPQKRVVRGACRGCARRGMRGAFVAVDRLDDRVHRAGQRRRLPDRRAARAVRDVHRIRRAARVPPSIVAIVGTLVIWYAFYKLLRVPLPWGVLERFAF